MATYKELYERILSGKTAKKEKVVTLQTLHSFKEVYDHVLETKLTNLDSKYVVQESGKGLSEVNFTREHEAKLNQIPADAEPNNINTVVLKDRQAGEGFDTLGTATIDGDTKTLTLDVSNIMSRYKMNTDEDEECYILDEDGNEISTSNVQAMNEEEIELALATGFGAEQV